MPKDVWKDRPITISVKKGWAGRVRAYPYAEGGERLSRSSVNGKEKEKRNDGAPSQP